ncbi:homolog to tryptophan--tRNA ligase [Halobacterium hubeiense]|uniref:Homolog to tryptophan--tRNA ligase n=1 Tax=Halobacterium hubeiense TaxID=1407499 RepID=A0A0U5H185_9EURY|nr:hypothetical protein [Halobacterium hubeiense]CQH51121.1 homolog to tryptophan--tRNA ligase [Halobacterium hubeiense]
MSALRDHYEAVREEFGYDRPDVDIGSLSASLVDRAFVAATDADALRQAGDRDTLFVASAGLTGPPHVGTLGQMYAVKRFHEAGFDAQFLLADYEKYASDGRDLDAVRDLADDYRTFLDRIGYGGEVRTQYDDRGVMQTAFRLAPHVEFEDGPEFDAESTEWVRRVRAAYDDDQQPPADATGSTDFGSRTAELLCLADFLHPTVAGGYDQTVFVLGVDEHALALANDYYAAKTPFEPAFEGLFTRMVPGLDGYPKMAKTIPGSGITMEMAPGEVRRLVREADDGATPAESTVYQMLCLVSEHDGKRLDELADACRAGGEEWDAAVEAYADFLADLAAAWPA